MYDVDGVVSELRILSLKRSTCLNCFAIIWGMRCPPKTTTDIYPRSPHSVWARCALQLQKRRRFHFYACMGCTVSGRRRNSFCTRPQGRFMRATVGWWSTHNDNIVETAGTFHLGIYSNCLIREEHNGNFTEMSDTFRLGIYSNDSIHLRLNDAQISEYE